MGDPATFKRGMRRLASGVSLITTLEGGTRHGFIATAVSSVAADPEPTLLICVNKSVSSHDVLRRSGVFCVNLLAEGDAALARMFSTSEHRHLRFSHGTWSVLGTGAPILSTALASFDCKVLSQMEVQTHSIFLGQVQDIAFGVGTDMPLVYADGGFTALKSTSAAA